MALERLPDGLAGLGVPQPRRLVVRRGDDALAVGAERRDGRPVRHNIRDGRPTRQNFSWPLSGSPIGLPVSASHSRAVLSSDAVTMCLPSGLNAALPKGTSWPLSGSPIGLPVSASHSRAVSSSRCGDDALAIGTERRTRHNLKMTFERLADWLAGLGVPQPRRLILRRGDDALAVGAERGPRYGTLMAPENKPLPQIAPSSIELQLRFSNIRTINPGRAIGQCLEREQRRGPGIARGALLTRKIGQEPRLRRLRLLKLAVSTPADSIAALFSRSPRNPRSR